MRKSIKKQTIIMVALALICGLFLFTWVAAENECPYHEVHTQECGYVEAVEGHECNHEHSEACYSTTLICHKDEHTHSDTCYDENGTLVCKLEEHTHNSECYELNCQHVHDETCGYQEAVLGQECTHRCSYCDKTLVREGKIEINQEDEQYTLHITSTLNGTKGDDQVYFYVKINEKILDKMSLLVVQDYKYEISYYNQDNELSHLILEPLYIGDENNVVYLKYEQQYGSTIEFDIPFKAINNLNGQTITITTASSYNEAEHKELSSYTFGNPFNNFVNRLINSDKNVDDNEEIALVSTYSTNLLSDDNTDASDSKTYLDGYIYDVELKKYVNNVPVVVTDGNVTDGDIINLSIDFSIPSDIVTDDNRSVYYQLPENVRPLKELSGYVYDKGVKKGVYSISADGLITITYDEEYTNGEALAGEIHFDGMVGLDGSANESQTVIIGNTSFTINPVVVPKDYDISTTKTVSKDENDSNKLHYTVKVNSDKGTESSILIEDTLTGGATYDQDSFVLVDKNNNSINVSNLIQFNSDGTSFTINNLPLLQEKSEYTLTYDVIVNPYQANTNGQQTIVNNIKASSGNVLDIDSTTTEISTQRITKSGNSTRGEGYITWKINLYNVQQGYEVVETLPDGLTWENTTATITPAINGNSNITFTQNSDGTYSYKIPDSVSTDTDYTITLRTKVDDPGDFDSYTPFTNNVELKTPEDGPTYSDDSTVTYYNERAVNKKFTNIVSSDSNGARYQWDVTLTTPHLADVTNYTYSDTLSSSNGNALHHLTSDFKNTLKITGEDGETISSDCYTIVYYDKNGGTTEDLSQAIKFEIIFNDNFKNLNPRKVNISYQSYADYTMGAGESSWFSNKGSIDYEENNTDKHFESSGDGQLYSKPSAITKSFVGESNTSIGGATYKWKSLLNLPPLNDLTEYIYEDTLSSDSNNGNHYIADEESFKNNLTIVDQDGKTIDSDLYTIEFVKNNSNTIVGFKINFVVSQMEGLTQLVINYQTNVKYDMLPSDFETYSNTASVNGSTSTASHSHTKEPAVNKNYTGYSEQTTDGAIYQWKSVLTLPTITDNTVYTYTDMVSSQSKNDNHYILKNDVNLSIKDESESTLSANQYNISYLDQYGKVIESVTDDTRIYGFTVNFDSSQLSNLKSNQLFLTYQTHVEYDMYPSESDTYINDATVKIDDKEFNDDASTSYRKDDAVKKTLTQTSNQSREGAEYTWTSTLTFPNNISLTKYEYIDQLSSSSQTTESCNHYIDKYKFNLQIKYDSSQETLDPKYYVVKYLDSAGNEINENDTDTKIVGFKISFNLSNSSDSASIVDLNPKKIYISYTTVAVYDMVAGESVDYRNTATAIINGKTYDVITKTSYTKEQLLKKLSGINKGIYKQDNEFGAYYQNRKIYIPEFFETNQIVNKEEIDGKIFYMILIKPDKTDGKDLIITVNDTLPENVSFIGTDHESDKTNDFAPYVMYYYSKWYYSDWGTEINGKQCYLDDYFNYKVEDNIVTFTLSEGYKDVYTQYSNGNNPYIAIVYAVDISDNSSYVEKDVLYTNTVEWNGEIVENTQKVHENGIYLDKVGIQLKDEELIRYSLIVNPAGEDLLENTDKIQLIDQMVNPEALSYLRFNPSSLKVYIYDAVNNRDIQELDKSLYSYTYDISTYKLIVNLPDNLSCRVEYDYYAENNTLNTVTITNNAIIEGIEETSISEDSQFEHVDSGSSVTKKRFTVYKVDSNNYNTTLPDASFTLFSYNSENNYWTTVNDNLVTDNNGKLDFVSLSSSDETIDNQLQEGVLYKLEETTPPEGYKIENPYTYFVIQQDNQVMFGEGGLITNQVLSLLNMNENEAKEKIKVLSNQGDDIYIPNTLNSIQVKKLWLNQDGTTTSPATDSINLKLYQGYTYNETYEGESFDVSVNFAGMKDWNSELQCFVKGYTTKNYIVGKDKIIHLNYYQQNLDYIQNNVEIKVVFENNETEIISVDSNNTSVDIPINQNMGIYIDYKVEPNEWSDLSYYFYIPNDNIGPELITEEHNQKELYKDDIILNSSNDWSISIYDLPSTIEIDGETVPCTYYIEEVNIPSGWTVSYEGNNVQSGNIVVKNIKDKESILLPETGGTLLVPMTILGITMMSLGIVYFKKKRHTHRKVGEFR